jgi:hypothetical protein
LRRADRDWIGRNPKAEDRAMSIDVRKASRERFEREQRQLRFLIFAVCTVSIAAIVTTGVIYVRRSQAVSAANSGEMSRTMPEAPAPSAVAESTRAREPQTPPAGATPASVAPTARAAPPKLPSVPDQSLDNDRYVELGFPSYDRTWSAPDMARTAECLKALAAKHPEQLPRFRSRRSGRVFARIVDRDSFKFIRQKSRPIAFRLTLGRQLVLSFLSVVELYASALADRKVGVEDMVDLIDVELEAVRITFDFNDEIRYTFPIKDPIREKRLAQQLEHMRQKTAEGVNLGLTAIRDAHTPLETRKRILASLQRNLPGLAPRLPSASRVELVLRLDRFAVDPHLKDLESEISLLRDELRAVVQEDVPRNVEPIAAEPDLTKPDLAKSEQPAPLPSQTQGRSLLLKYVEMSRPTPENIVPLVILSVLTLCFAPILCLIHAFLLKLAAGWVQGLELTFGAAYVTSLFVALGTWGLSLVLNIGYALSAGVARWGTVPLTVGAIVLTWLVWPTVIRLRHDTTFGQAFLIFLAMMLILTGITVALMVIALMIVGLIAFGFRRA